MEVITNYINTTKPGDPIHNSLEPTLEHPKVNIESEKHHKHHFVFQEEVYNATGA